MEGLIPYVFRAIKRSRERSSYRCLSRATSAVFEGSPLLRAGTAAAEEYYRKQPQSQPDDYRPSPSSRGCHHRARSELPPPPPAAPGRFVPSDGRLRQPSRSLRWDSCYRPDEKNY